MSRAAKAHAEKVIAIFNAWSPSSSDFQQNDAKVLAGWTGYGFCNARRILHCTDSGPEATSPSSKKMLLGVYYLSAQGFLPRSE